MKRLLLILSVMVVGVFGFNTATASASNCNMHASAITWQGILSYYPYFDGCTTDTDSVQTHAPAGGYGGIWDITFGQFYSASYGGDTRSPGWPCGCFSPMNTYGTPSWCGGQVHAVQPMYYFRLHSTISQAWGPWHLWNTATVRNINC